MLHEIGQDRRVTLYSHPMLCQERIIKERLKVTEYNYSLLEICTTQYIDVYDGNGVPLISNTIHTIGEDGLLTEEEVHDGDSYKRVEKVTIDAPA
jgi:hypothetical protein